MVSVISSKSEIKRVPLYIEGFDETMQGGIPEGHITLISGSAGTMKSSIVFNTLYNEALKGSIESLPIVKDLLNQFENFDLDIKSNK